MIESPLAAQQPTAAVETLEIWGNNQQHLLTPMD
jgi:hypothetical protein